MARYSTLKQYDRIKRHAVGLRVTGERRRQLELAADRSGRSISAEIELRMERSFWDDEVMGGSEMHAVFRMMASAAALIMSRVPVTHSKAWLEDPQIFQAVRQSWMAIIDGLDPSKGHTGRKITEARHNPALSELGLVDIIRQGMEYIPRPVPTRRSRKKRQQGDG